MNLSSLLAKHKLIVQIFAAFLVVYLGGIKIDGLNGLFGIESFGWYFDEIFTVSVIVILTNAFNLIDGIDGLAGTIALVISLFLDGRSIMLECLQMRLFHCLLLGLL